MTAKSLLPALALGLVIATAESSIVGKNAPDWKVKKRSQLPPGKAGLELSDLKGKVVYLYCFQSWCPGCHSHGFPLLKKMVEKCDGDDEVAVVAVQTVFEGSHTNTAENGLKCAKKFGLKIPFGFGGSKEVRSEIMRAYQTRGTPWTIVIGPKGIVHHSDFRGTEEKMTGLIDKLKKDAKPAGGK